MASTLLLVLLVVASLEADELDVGAAQMVAAWQAESAVRQTFFEADLVSVGQGSYQGLGLPPGELVDAELPAGPDGTGTAFVESFQYQLGALYQPTGRSHRLLVAYHGYGGSAASVAAQSTLDEACNQRGWVYVSVTGLDDKLFGTDLSQQHTEAVIQWMLDHHNIDPDQICMVGFSMGAGVALNFAARHRDPDGLMLAGLGLVSTSADWTSAWTVAGAAVKDVLEHPLNFGTTPSQDPFVYRRWSGTYHDDPNLLSVGVLQADQSMASNLGTLPIYMTWDTGDQTTYVADQCVKLASHLGGLGGELMVKKVTGTLDPDSGVPAPHSWAVLKENQLLKFFDGRRADRLPARVHALVTEDVTVGGLSIQQRSAGAFSELDVDFGPELRVSGVQNTRSVDLFAGGVSADRRLAATPEDGLSFDLRLRGFKTRPSYLVAAGGGALVQDVRSEPSAHALVVTVPADGLQASLVSRADWNGTLTVSPDPAPVGSRILLRADGPPQARSAWLVFGAHEALTPVLGSAAVLGVVPRTPAFIRKVLLDAQGNLELAPVLPPSLPTPGGHLHVQALFFDAGQKPVSTSNVWMLRWSP